MAIVHWLVLSWTSRKEQNQDKRLNTKGEMRQRKDNKHSTYGSVIGVDHLDWNQGAPKYLYKKVEVCIQVRNILENA